MRSSVLALAVLALSGCASSASSSATTATTASTSPASTTAPTADSTAGADIAVQHLTFTTKDGTSIDWVLLVPPGR